LAAFISAGEIILASDRAASFLFTGFRFRLVGVAKTPTSKEGLPYKYH
jgi:hypothetical protein